MPPRPPTDDPTLAEASALATPGARLRELAARSPRHRRAVAANAAAPAELLRELAGETWLGAVIASNPAVPLDLLWQLARSSPREVIANPLFQLAMLVQPDLGAIPRWSLWSLFRTALLPDDWYRWACDHAVAQGLGGHWLLFDLAQLEHAPVEVLRRLGRLQPFLYEPLLGNPALPPDVVKRIGRSSDPKMQVLLARSRHARPDWLTAMARSRVVAVRAAVAGQGRTPAAVLARLADDPAPEVRAAVSTNWFTPPEVLRLIDGVPAPGLLGNPSLPAARARELIAAGAGSAIVTVRHGELLAEALAARDGQRRRRDGQRPGREGLAARLAEGARPAVLRQAARAATQSPAMLDRLARSPRYALRLAVAGNPATAPATLARLAGDRRYEVRREVARHASTPAAVRAWLVDDPAPAVRRVARARAA
ncbi:MAG: hypothetical protein EOO75_02410 [Myxococcales bacterium]|nr:MAG: hypothetical protein EOO75_02410 [Myxococcales bacterium]